MHNLQGVNLLNKKLQGVNLLNVVTRQHNVNNSAVWKNKSQYGITYQRYGREDGVAQYVLKIRWYHFNASCYVE